MSDSIKRLKELNAENQRVVRVNVGVLRAAITEISVHVAANRKGIMTDMVLDGLKAAIGGKGLVRRDSVREGIEALRSSGVQIDAEKIMAERQTPQPVPVLYNELPADKQEAERALFDAFMATDYSPDQSGATSEADEQAFLAVLFHIWQARASLSDRHISDLVMMVKLLCRTVKKYNPTSQQAKDFMAYLQREALISTSDILRASPGEALKDPE